MYVLRKTIVDGFVFKYYGNLCNLLNYIDQSTCMNVPTSIMHEPISEGP